MSSTHSPKYRRLLDRLQSARETAGLTQADVAKAFGRPQSFVSKCESGERRIDVLELDQFASLYGRPLGYFLGEDASGGASLAAETTTRAGRSSQGKTRSGRRQAQAGSRKKTRR
jgi:transcriptional regulator with XRE-family HTH domain